MRYWYHRKCCKIKWIVTLERLIEYKWTFLGIQVFMRAFYDNINQVDCIFSSKVVILPTNRKHYLKIKRPLIFSASDTVIKLFSFLILTRTFQNQNWPNKRYSISGSKKIVSLPLYAFFFCLLITADVSKNKKHTQYGLHSTFNVLSKYLNILV